MRVYEAVRRIPPGQVAIYASIANAIGCRSSAPSAKPCGETRSPRRSPVTASLPLTADSIGRPSVRNSNAGDPKPEGVRFDGQARIISPPR